MLKSLFSGVSGLQSHQIAMDVESNNIANVNTVGFKYSRANFSDLLAQTKSIATAPQGSLGGKNAVQVGLGSTVSSMTRIFSQGSVQNSDKNTDMAIQGDGFFIISPDNGSTYKYTRSGDFKFDAGGNFVDNNGFVAQGWLRDEVTGKVDSTAPITSLNIAPGLTTPANPTSEVVLKANLNSGQTVDSYSPSYSVASGTPPSAQTPAIFTGDAVDDAGAPIASGDLGVMFNETGEAFSLQSGQGMWASFKSSEVAGTTPVAGGANDLDITFTLDDGSTKQITSTGAIAGNTAAQNGSVYISAINAQTAVTGITATYNATTNRINLSNDNSNASASHNIEIAAVGNTNSGLTIANGTDTTAYKYLYDPAGSSAVINSDKTFTTMSDLRYAMEQQARAVGDHDGVTPNAAAVAAHTYTLDGLAAAPAFVMQIDGISVSMPAVLVTDTATQNATAYAQAINDAAISDISAAVVGAQLVITNSKTSNATVTTPAADGAFQMNALTTTIMTAAAINAGSTQFTAGVSDATGSDDGVTFTLGGINIIVPDSGIAANTALANAGIYVAAINGANIPGITATDDGAGLFTIVNTTSDTAPLITATDVGQTGFTGDTTVQIPARAGDGTVGENNIEIIVTDQGKFQITNPGGSADGDYAMNLKITGYSTTSVTENIKFTTNMVALSSTLPVGSTGKAFSQSFNAATHSSSIDVFDSLGSKHTLRMELRKTALDKATGSTWDMKLTVPEPATIDTVAPFNEKNGSIRFNNDGSLATYDPSSISFSGNNGSSPEQQVNLSFGTANAFDGMTSFDSSSSTSGISQDGFTGGDLVGIRIDQSGTLVGSFSNGRSFGLAQVAMAKFTNNEGLGTEGGNIYTQSANSGDPIIGTAATAGRGFIQASALEASNVDLSRALTQLIIIQRGFQANGKTITTSDQLLQTLIGLKN